MTQNEGYERDVGKGKWLDEYGCILITSSKRWDATSAIAELSSEEGWILISPSSNRVINQADERGGRFAFTIPKSLFLKTEDKVFTRELLRSYSSIRTFVTQRAPGHVIRMRLKPSLHPSQKEQAFNQLKEQPLIIQLTKTNSMTNRLTFGIYANDFWEIEQPQKGQPLSFSGWLNKILFLCHPRRIFKHYEKRGPNGRTED